MLFVSSTCEQLHVLGENAFNYDSCSEPIKAVPIVFSELGVAQVFLPRRQLFGGHAVREVGSSFSLRERRNDHDFVTRLKRKEVRLRGKM